MARIEAESWCLPRSASVAIIFQLVRMNHAPGQRDARTSGLRNQQVS